MPCLIYVTFNNKIMVYYNINMPQIGLTNLVETMEQKDSTEDLIGYFNVDCKLLHNMNNLARIFKL